MEEEGRKEGRKKGAGEFQPWPVEDSERHRKKGNRRGWNGMEWNGMNEQKKETAVLVTGQRGFAPVVPCILGLARLYCLLLLWVVHNPPLLPTLAGLFSALSLESIVRSNSNLPAYKNKIK